MGEVDGATNTKRCPLVKRVTTLNKGVSKVVKRGVWTPLRGVWTPRAGLQHLGNTS
jgi:hypothetical protein